MDKTTETGMDPFEVASAIYHAVIYPVQELNLSDLKSKCAIYVRTFLPSIYFKIMQLRARGERKTLKKSI